MYTVGVVAGSFDPITRGHEWLIAEAARLVDELHVVIGINPSKKYTFSDQTRLYLVRAAVSDLNLVGTPTQVHFLSNQLLIQFALEKKATHLIRGIRDQLDFNYEIQMARVNKKIAPEIRTLYLSPPAELCEVSSSTVKSLVGFQGWTDIVKDYIHPSVLAAFQAQLTQGV